MPLHDTRGAASATGFGFGASTGGPDWSQYMIVPLHPTSTGSPYTEVKFYNVVKNTTDYTVSIPSSYRASQTKLIRIGNFLFVMYQNYGIYGAVYNILTGATVYSGVSWGVTSSEEGDVAKFGENKLIFVQKSGTALSWVTYSFDLVTGAATYITSGSFSSLFGNSATGYASPQIAASCTMNADGVFDSFNNYITFNAVHSYSGGATQTAWGSFYLNNAGTVANSVNTSVTNVNFSRPAAATGDTNRTWVAVFDDNEYVIYSYGSPAGGYVNGNYPADATNLAAAGIATQTEFMFAKYNSGASNTEMIRYTAGAKTTSTYLSSDPTYGPAYAIQMFKGGMVAMVQSSAGGGGAPIFYRYDRATDSWSSAVPNGITGRVNPYLYVVRIYNY